MKILIAVSVLIAVLSGCAKKDFTIGKGAPGDEIQKCLKLSEKKRFEEAIECLEVFKSRFPQTTYSTEAELAIADNHFRQKEYLLAADAYLLFIKMHPTNPKADYAYFRLGLSYLKESPEAIDRDQQYLDEAIQYLSLTVKSFPGSQYNEAAKAGLFDARTRVAERTFYIGNFYYRTGEYKAAIPRFIDVVNDFPETKVVPKTLYKLVVSAGRLQMIDDAKIFFSRLELNFPDNEWTKRAEEEMEGFVKKYGQGKTGESGEAK